MIVDIDEESVVVNATFIEKAQIEWRKRGLVGKFHNVVVGIRASPQRRESFQRYFIGNAKIDSIYKNLLWYSFINKARQYLAC